MDVHGLILILVICLIISSTFVTSSSSTEELNTFISHNYQNPYNKKPPDLTSTCSDDSLTKGYKCLDYDVITDDGYILRIERFPEGRINTDHHHHKKQPVFIQHGILVDGMNWFTVAHADEALPLILVEAGYDIWIGNSRGTRFSRKHVDTNLTWDKTYWDFSFSEMGEYDLPTCLNFVYQETGQKVHYIGHSLGTTMMFAAFSEWEVETMVKSVTLLSPIAFLNHITTELSQILAHAYAAEIAGAFGIPFLDLGIEPLGAISKAICNVPGINCFDIISLFSGPNCCMNSSTVNLVLNNLPQATSMKTLVHLSQNVRVGKFAKYDYGNPATNLEHYGTPMAPVYNLHKIPKNMPLLLCYGGKDALADTKDVHRTLEILSYSENLHEIYIDNYAHLDFINGITAKDVLYPSILSFIKSH